MAYTQTFEQKRTRKIDTGTGSTNAIGTYGTWLFSTLLRERSMRREEDDRREIVHFTKLGRWCVEILSSR
jgi:hypothetical protein